LVGDNDGDVNDCYYDKDTTGDESSVYGMPRTTDDMKIQATYVDWDFAGDDVDGTQDIWSINPSINSGYPYLTNNAP
jgi:hypothetical protein